MHSGSAQQRSPGLRLGDMNFLLVFCLVDACLQPATTLASVPDEGCMSRVAGQGYKPSRLVGGDSRLWRLEAGGPMRLTAAAGLCALYSPQAVKRQRFMRLFFPSEMRLQVVGPVTLVWLQTIRVFPATTDVNRLRTAAVKPCARLLGACSCLPLSSTMTYACCWHCDWLHTILLLPAVPCEAPPLVTE